MDIAAALEVPDGTVRRWKNTYSWESERSDKKSERSETKRAKKKITIDDGTRETLQNDKLTPERQMFCIYYNRTFNATQSYQKAYGCSYRTALVNGPRLLGIASVRKEIERLKENKRKQIVCSESDIVELQMRIAFSDISDSIEVKGKSVLLKPLNEIDSQMIKEIRETKHGISIKIEDRQKALDWLTKYFLMYPEDKHKQEFDRQKMELELLKLELQTKTEEESDDSSEDNFLEALNASAKDVWSDE